MIKRTIVRRVDLPRNEQKQLAVIFADDPTHPLSLSTVSNYLNESRYNNPKAKRIREFAVEKLGGEWIEEIKIIRA